MKADVHVNVRIGVIGKTCTANSYTASLGVIGRGDDGTQFEHRNDEERLLLCLLNDTRRQLQPACNDETTKKFFGGP